MAKPRLFVPAFLFATIATAFFFHFGYHNIADPDSLYHLRHAWLYRTGSLFTSAFPWTQYSVIRTDGSDLWYGFHLLLIPFTYGDMILGLRLAGVFLTLLLLLSFAWIAVRHRLSQPFFWPFLLFFGIPNALFLFVMVRPHMLSLIGGLLLLSFLIRGSWPMILASSFAITFFHLSYFWFGPTIVVAVAAVRFAESVLARRENPTAPRYATPWKLVVVVVTGSLLGLLARPAPVAAARLAYVQIVQLALVKLGSFPLTFGTELRRLPIRDLLQSSTLFLIMWLAALVLFVKTLRVRDARAEPDGEETLLWASGALSTLFFVLSLGMAIRFFVVWVVFGTLFMGLLYSRLPAASLIRRKGPIVLPLLFLFMIPFALWRHRLNETYVATPPGELRGVSEWLVTHTAPRDIVFDAHWDDFAPLFFRNQRDYYVGGMDPIFEYAYSPRLYWETYYVSLDAVSDSTCDRFPCSREGLVDTYQALRNDFKARYVLVAPSRNPRFYKYLAGDKRYVREFEDQDAAVFAIVR
jgi:hypothetical protein